MLETPSFLGDAKIQYPQEVGLQAGSVKLALSLQVCDHTQQLCPQMIKGLGPYKVALDLAPHTPIKDIEVWTGSGPRYLLDLSPIGSWSSSNDDWAPRLVASGCRYHLHTMLPFLAGTAHTEA